MTDSKIKCVIVEDEQHNTELLEHYIGQIHNLELLGSFTNPIELLNFPNFSEVQIIYLDIQMPGMTGVEFLKAKPTNAAVIFTTAYSEYALDGYELEIVDYLLKPVELPRFIKATQKAIKQIYINNYKDITPNITPDFIFFKVNKKLIKVLVADIIYIKADWNYIHVYTTKGKYIVLSTMKGIEANLSIYNFIRIHKSYLINPQHFESIEDNIVRLNGDIELTVSRNYKQVLINYLSQ